MNDTAAKKPKTSLHLLGGGVTGVFFHIGAMAALDDHLSLKSTNFDRYVGVSAGSLVATSSALGVQAQDGLETPAHEALNHHTSGAALVQTGV